jgi:hypothetical protein
VIALNALGKLFFLSYLLYRRIVCCWSGPSRGLFVVTMVLAGLSHLHGFGNETNEIREGRIERAVLNERKLFCKVQRLDRFFFFLN